ncbi:MAG: aminotransferase class V-fold PLP-dependent enzyme [Candidatus Sericytochromatia bacterium]
MFENLVIPQELLPKDGRFGSGPTKVPVEFLEKLYKTGKELLGNSHRNPIVLDLVKRCRTKLKNYFNIPDGYEILLGNGGASIVWESLAFSVVKEKSAHFTCGEFSSKWHSLTKATSWLKTEKFDADYGLLPELAYTGDADLIAMTHNETSTGVMIPSCPSFNSDALVAVDATSIAGVVNWNFEKTDLYYFSLQKAFGSEGGLFFAVASPKFMKRVEDVKKSGRYIPSMLSFDDIVSNSLKNQTLNTPSITSLFFLECALDEFISRGGIHEIEKEARRKADLIYSFAESSKFLSPYVKDEKLRSLSVATIDIVDEVSADDLVSAFRKNGIFDINSYRKLNRNQIRIGIFPFVSYDDLKKLTECFDFAFSQL